MSDPTSSSRSARNSVSPLEALRQRAEAKLRAVVSSHPNDASPGDLPRLLHELSVHQAELEMQNEELNRAQSALEASRARYFDLYDQAPVGYITFGMDGLVLEANRLAASMLGLAANRLPGRRGRSLWFLLSGRSSRNTTPSCSRGPRRSRANCS